ncbi:type IV secretion system protein TraC [Pseudomonadota bacterium]
MKQTKQQNKYVKKTKKKLAEVIDFDAIRKKCNKHINKLLHENTAYKEKKVNFTEYHPISALLPYRMYDPDNGLFINKNSVGFMLEATPLIGADMQTVNILTGMITDDVPTNCLVQVNHLASSRIGDMLDEWYQQRIRQGGILAKQAEERMKKITEGAFKSMFPDCDYVFKDSRVFISVAISANSNSIAYKKLLTFRRTLLSTLSSIEMKAKEVNPEDLLSFLDEIINTKNKHEKNATVQEKIDNLKRSKVQYNPLDPINIQVTSPENNIYVKKDKLLLGEDTVIKAFTVKEYPELWTQWENSDLIGDFMKDSLRIGCPFMTTFSFIVSDEEKNKTRANTKLVKTSHQAGTWMSKWDSKIKKREMDWRFVCDKVNSGKKIVKCFYSVVLFSTKDKIEEDEQKLKSIYKTQGWQLVSEDYIQLISFLASLPFTQFDGTTEFTNKKSIKIPFLSQSYEGLARDLDKMGRLRTMVTWTVANIMQLQGEWKGMQSPSMLLYGRRGQPFFWSPFDNKEGNFNVAVIGKSGSGKSVFMNDYVVSQRSNNGKVYIIDDGRSFENTCKVQGGNFVCFDGKNPVCMNPFSLVSENDMYKTEYREEVLNFINQLVEQMCSPKGNLDEVQQNTIHQAVKETWEKYKTKATITNVQEYLKVQKDSRIKDLAIQLQAYSKGGIFEGYYEGECTLKLDNPLMVFELSELKNKGNLQTTVMMTLMFIISQEMYFGDRTTKISLIIDEAWDLLSGGELIGKFIEGFVRRARKYGGNLVTGTQSIDDFQKTSAARAAFQNSDHVCLLAQKPETIAQLKETKKLIIDSHMEKVLKSLRRKGQDYSEVFIYTNGQWAIGRLIMDMFSIVLYSTDADDYKAVQQYQKEGCTVIHAVEKRAKEKEKERELKYA